MTYQGIGTGTTPNDNSGDSLLTGALKINSNFKEIYNALGDGNIITFDRNRNVDTGDGLSGGGNLTADRTLTVDSTVLRTSGEQTINGSLTATSFVGNGTIPVGGIIMWSGTATPFDETENPTGIPTGWALCDGETYDSRVTPDLRDRFVVGAGVSYSVNATGGSANAVLIAHSHGTYGTESGYRHAVRAGVDAIIDATSQTNDANDAYYDEKSRTDVTGLDAVGIASTTQTGTNANLPPYYALAFIMRTA